MWADRIFHHWGNTGFFVGKSRRFLLFLAGLCDVLPNAKPYVPRIGKVGTRASKPSNILIFSLSWCLFPVSECHCNLWFCSRESRSWWGNRSVWKTLLNLSEQKTKARWGKSTLHIYTLNRAVINLCMYFNTLMIRICFIMQTFCWH